MQRNVASALQLVIDAHQAKADPRR